MTTMTTTASEAAASWFVPDWPAPASVHSLVTTRAGGVSRGAYASLNLGAHVGDDESAVRENRARLRAQLGSGPYWLEQVHGVAVVEAKPASADAAPVQADAALAREAGAVCAVLTADCLPVLFCDTAGSVVAAAHAGWRGLLAGVLEQTLEAMGVPGGEVLAYLGPAIGPQAFEVGDEVRAAFLARAPEAACAFTPGLAAGKWYADLYTLARQRLAGAGVARIFGGGLCTFSDPARFFSYRRDGVCGRMASLIWLAPAR
jgi:YfiH family protein